jgi:hypothetical protein
MNAIEERADRCPYCGEPITLLVDASEPDQNYIEDCQVCCQPMVVNVQVEGEDIHLELRQEND